MRAPHRQVGKHLGDVQAALPLRSVCKDWSETVTMTSDAARFDLHPEADAATEAVIKRPRVLKLCPNIRHLTYFVSPRVTQEQVRAAARGGVGVPRNHHAPPGGALPARRDPKRRPGRCDCAPVALRPRPAPLIPRR